MGLLMDALYYLGIEAKSLNDNGKAPILIRPGYEGGETNIMGNVSSQFISSILISSPLSLNGVKLYVLPEFKSRPYVNMTLDIMRKFGVKTLTGYYLKHDDCDKPHQGCRIDEFIVRKQDYAACDYTVEGDYSSASYLLALIAINGGKARIKNLFRDSKQGDKYILDILQKMGATIIRGEDYVEIASEGNLKAIDVNLSNAPDLLITVAVLAAMAEGTTNITGVAHARVKETDRIDTTCRELEKLGCKLTEREDGMSITGGVSSGIVDSHGDHRLAMAFSLIGLRHDIEITNGEVFDVSFPNFIEAMAELGFELELENE
jgi:3-phosphoshikimate 1-carboxyvinyltransferase